jgi:ribose 5-phosphate isomerase B
VSYVVALGADHGGFSLKSELSTQVRQSHRVLDVGAATFDPDDDYPEYAEAVARAVASGSAQRGIVICGSGVGACVAANKVAGVRASVCHDTYSAHQGVEHDDMNVLCLGARIVGLELARELVAAFLAAHFSGEERHQRRLDEVLDIERRSLQGQRPDAGGSR